MNRPPKTLGMRHVALNVADLEACEHFYVGLLGMTVEWRSR
jgi:catechol 2,3-dioxygenase-like lactoylglutathione lyase family enzyme